MSYQGKGGLWLNADRYNPSAPDFKGSVTIDGKSVGIVGWRNKGTNPKAPYISLVLDIPEITTPCIRQEILNDDDFPF